MSDNLGNFSAYLDAKIRARLAGMTREQLEAELLLLHRTVKVVEEMGEAMQKLIGLTGANPRKGVDATPDELVEEFHDVAVSVLGAGEHVRGNTGGMLGELDARIQAVAVRAGLVPAGEGCTAERFSTDFFSSAAVDPHWMRCHRVGPHDEHENSETGATWRDER